MVPIVLIGILEWRTTFEIYVMAEVESPLVDNPEHKGRKILEKKMMFMARVSLQW